MAHAGHSRTARVALQNERSAPPRFGSLTDGLAPATTRPPRIELPTRKPATPVDTRVHPPVAIAVMSAPVIAPERPMARTTVAAAGQAMVTKPPTLEQVATKVDLAVPAKLHYVAGVAGAVAGRAAANATIVAAGAVPLSRLARGGVAAVSLRGGVADARDRLKGMTARLGGAPLRGARAVRGSSDVAAGEIAVLRLPNASRDLDEKGVRPRLAVTGGALRMVALGHGGQVLADEIVGTAAAGRTAGTLPRGAERIAVTPAAEQAETRPGLLGWHAGCALPYIGWSTALASGATVRAEGASIQSGRLRRTAGWVEGAELVAGTSIVVTEFRDRVTVVVVALDDPTGTSAGRGLSLGLTGAARATDRGGAPRAARGVVRGNRTFLLYEIVPERSAPVAVTVASQDGWHLAGVMAGTAPIGVLADLLTTRGLDAIVRPVSAGATGTRTLKWTSGSAPAPPGTPIRPRPPRRAERKRPKTAKRKPKTRAARAKKARPARRQRARKNVRRRKKR
jgi:hypothetical protein